MSGNMMVLNMTMYAIHPQINTLFGPFQLGIHISVSSWKCIIDFRSGSSNSSKVNVKTSATPDWLDSILEVSITPTNASTVDSKQASARMDETLQFHQEGAASLETTVPSLRDAESLLAPAARSLALENRAKLMETLLTTMHVVAVETLPVKKPGGQSSGKALNWWRQAQQKCGQLQSLLIQRPQLQSPLSPQACLVSSALEWMKWQFQHQGMFDVPSVRADPFMVEQQ
ncbi:hypothetical protein BJ742DRAFT_778237 [Cladochytrium replicatum]|nr:hypothetical protein BJ742DRAFT_778237 [Cladochytrium replicatum]